MRRSQDERKRREARSVGISCIGYRILPCGGTNRTALPRLKAATSSIQPNELAVSAALGNCKFYESASACGLAGRWDRGRDRSRDDCKRCCFVAFNARCFLCFPAGRSSCRATSLQESSGDSAGLSSLCEVLAWKEVPEGPATTVVYLFLTCTMIFRTTTLHSGPP